MSEQDPTRRPALLNPELQPGEPYLEESEMRVLWQVVSVDVHPDLSGKAVNDLDELAAKGNRAARALLFQFAVEGAQARLERDREDGATDAQTVTGNPFDEETWPPADEQGSHRALYGEPNAIIR